MRFLYCCACFFGLTACYEGEITHEKETKAPKMKPEVLHKKNVNIVLDSVFWQRLEKHYMDDHTCSRAKFKYGISHKSENPDISYFACNFPHDKAFWENDSAIRATLRLEELFGYKEKGVLFNVLGWDWNFGVTSDFTKLYPDVNVAILCYRSYEKLQGVCQMMERFYLFSYKGNKVKDIVACNLFPKDTSALYVIPHSAESLSLEEVKERHKMKHQQKVAWLYYKHYNKYPKYCREIPKIAYKSELPMTLTTAGSTIIATKYAVINSEACIFLPED